MIKSVVFTILLCGLVVEGAPQSNKHADYVHSYIPISGRSYKLHLEAVTWPVAEATCRSEGAQLAVVNDAGEGGVIGDISLKSAIWPFVGVYRNSSGQWTTVTGEDPVKTAGFNLWTDGEPLSDEKRRYAVVLRRGWHVTMLDDAENPFICEKAS